MTKLFFFYRNQLPSVHNQLVTQLATIITNTAITTTTTPGNWHVDGQQIKH